MLSCLWLDQARAKAEADEQERGSDACLATHHCDMIGDAFWLQRPGMLQSDGRSLHGRSHEVRLVSHAATSQDHGCNAEHKCGDNDKRDSSRDCLASSDHVSRASGGSANRTGITNMPESAKSNIAKGGASSVNHAADATPASVCIVGSIGDNGTCVSDCKAALKSASSISTESSENHSSSGDYGSGGATSASTTTAQGRR